ncbi:MAG TPA: CoA pyrophosphatase [Gammaproteobacteria bacterium]|nr:CoA pyrophosphatase [Gammaproteobacteria bacterium]
MSGRAGHERLIMEPGVLKARLLTCLEPLVLGHGHYGDGVLEAEVPAAVLIPIITDKEPQILFTRRAEHLIRHGGQISFPGGQIEAHDNSPLAAALREAREEIGLDPSRVSPVGRLTTRSITTGYAVTPIVGLLPAGTAFTPNPDEVAEIFPVPLAYLMDSDHYQVQSAASCHGRSHPTLALQYRQHRIWGATAAMLSELCSRWHRATKFVTLYDN